MSTKHTPGPWKVVSASACREIDVFEIAEVAELRVIHAAEAWPTAGTPENDARLIAAAPELLEALRKCLAHVHPDTSEAKEANAAISKATGEQA